MWHQCALQISCRQPAHAVHGSLCSRAADFNTLQQQAGWQLKLSRHNILRHYRAPCLAVASTQAVQQAAALTVQQLLQHVRSRTWDATTPQLDVLKRALAEFLVLRANHEQLKADGEVTMEPTAYERVSAEAGRMWREVG